MKKFIIIGAVAGLIVLAGIIRWNFNRSAKNAVLPLDPKAAYEADLDLEDFFIEEVSNSTVKQLFVNGRGLTSEEEQTLTSRYGAIASGQYWYDSRSGLFGRMGEGTLGLIEAGYNFGYLEPGAANGNTSIFINGREITTLELALLTRSVGNVAPGAYWLNANGDYGVVGNATALGNLYAIARANGGAATGDNFWSAGNFGAGNYNADNTQGYVSVPGEGLVDYGF